MKNTWKKLLALLLAAVMVFALCACNTESDTDDDDEEEGNALNPNLGGVVPGNPPFAVGPITPVTPADPVTPDNGGDDPNPVVPDDDEDRVHDAAYYLDLPSGREGDYAGVVYDGRIKLTGIVYETQPTFKALMENYPGMAIEKDSVVDPNTEISVRYEELPDDAFLRVHNRSSLKKKLIDLPITGIILPITEETQLTDIVGDIEADVAGMTFIDAMVEYLGLPFMVEQYVDGSLWFFFDYEACTVYLTYDLETQTGEFELVYKG